MSPIEKATSILKGLIGTSSWGGKLGVGNMLTLEFGPADSSRGFDGGTWSLWTRWSAWRVEIEEQIVMGSSDEGLGESKGLASCLDQIKVLQAAITAQSDLVVQFVGGVTLKVFPDVSEDKELWILFAPDGMALAANPHKGCEYSRSDLPPSP